MLEDIQEDKEIYNICSMCKACFDNIRMYKKHVLNCNEIKTRNFSCVYCKQVLSSKQVLCGHINRCTKKYNYIKEMYEDLLSEAEKIEYK